MYVKGTVSPMPGFAGLRGRGLGRLRGRVRVLGCSSCSAKKLGQDDSSIYDIQYGGGNTEAYDTGVSYGPAGGASSSFAPPTLGPSTGGGFTISTGPTIPASILSNSPFSNPATVMSQAASPLALAYGAQALTPPTAAQYAAIGVPATGTVAAAGAAPVSSISNYLPYLLLGLGGIAVIAVLKRR